MSLNTAETQVGRIEPPSVAPAVTGWLLYLCLLLTIVYPAMTLYHIVTHTLPSLFAGHSVRFIFLYSVYYLIFGALAVFSFVAGMKLWLVRPGAVRLVRLWLWTYLFANFAYFGLWLAIAKHPNSLSLAEMGWY